MNILKYRGAVLIAACADAHVDIGMGWACTDRNRDAHTTAKERERLIMFLNVLFFSFVKKTFEAKHFMSRITKQIKSKINSQEGKKNR